MVRTLLFVGLGGSLGAIGRYLIGLWLAPPGVPSGFPTATFVVNILGSLFLGVLSRLASETTWISDDLRGLLMIGFLGAFTTFSTFSSESFNLMAEGRLGLLAGYLLASLSLGIAAVAIGRAAAALWL
jgi:CrcB protein